MGDEPVELELDYGAVVHEEDEAAYDPYYDAEYSDDDANGYHASAAGVKQEETRVDVGYGGGDHAELLGPIEEEEEEQEDYPLPMQSDDEEESAPNDQEDAQSQKQPARIYQPSSLLAIVTQKIASRIEKFPPSSFGVLSEYHWESVIRARIAINDKKKESAGAHKPKGPKGRNHIGYDGDCGRKKMPALSEKVLLPIERHPDNAHLARSKAADELVWRAIVDHNFGGMNRPRSMEVPCDVVKDRLRGWGEKLSELMARPPSCDEFLESEDGKELKNRMYGELQSRKEARAKEKAERDAEKKRKRRVDDLFGEEEEEDDDEPAGDDGALEKSQEKEAYMAYRQHLAIETNKRTNALRFVLESLKQSPMDIKLLSETEIGKSSSKAVKSMKKLGKQISKNDDEREIEETLCGHPRFWKEVGWGEEPQRMRNNQSDRELSTTPYQFLQQILQDWKDMASENGADIAASPPTKKQKTADSTAIATCGKDKRVSDAQHQIDMKLLHSSPDWRSLYQSLRKRAAIMQKAHGEKIRGIRESLEKERSKVGKVTLKRAVGRVRGNISGAKAAVIGSTGNAAKSARREAILNGSRGNRAIQQQVRSAASGTPKGGGKMSQLRQETRVASSWRKSGVAKKPPSAFSMSVATSSFGASVASAGSRGNSKKPQTSFALKGGKSIKLPPRAGGLGKTVGIGGVFSTLQKKKEVKEQKEQRQRREVQQQRQMSKLGGAGSRKMQQLRKQGNGYRMTQQPQRGGGGDRDRRMMQQQRGGRDGRDRMQQQRKRSRDDDFIDDRYY